MQSVLDLRRREIAARMGMISDTDPANPTKAVEKDGTGAAADTAVTKAELIRATAAIPDVPGARTGTTLRPGAVFQTAIDGD